LPPLQDHAATLIITGIGKVVWERITDVGDVAFLLPEMEVSRKHSIKPTKVFGLDLAMIRHFHHGIHLEMRQFKMSKHVF
jgi:hypothetical protein